MTPEEARWIAQREAALAEMPQKPRPGRAQGEDWIIERDGRPFNLSAWHRSYGHHLPLVAIVTARWSLSTVRGENAGNTHVPCPLMTEHSDPADRGGTFVADSDGLNRARTVCNHSHGQGLPQGAWLAVWLSEEVLTWADLDAAEAACRAEAGTPPGAEVFADLPAPKPEPEQPAAPEPTEELWQRFSLHKNLGLAVETIDQEFFTCGPDVAHAKHDEVLGTRRFSFYSHRTFTGMFRHQRVKIIQDGKLIEVNPAAVWLDHPLHRHFQNGLRFRPMRPVPPGYFNLWQGFGVTPVPGDWSMLREHLRCIWACEDEIVFRYLMGWAAHLVQRPWEKPSVMILAQGDPGTGRGILGHALLKLMGAHGRYLAVADRLLKQFNAALRDQLLIFADEALFPGDHKGRNALKALISEHRMNIEAKFQDESEEANYLRVLAVTNNDWAIALSPDSRRELVVRVSDAHKQDIRYFKAIQDQLDAGGYQAMLAELQTWDLSDFNMRVAPETEARREQRLRTVEGELAWYLTILSRGYVFDSPSKLPEFREWIVEVSMDLLYESYLGFMKDRRFEGRGVSRETLGRFLIKRMLLAKTRLSKAMVGERPPMRGMGPVPVIAARAYGFRLGMLTAAREQFDRLVPGLHVDWEPVDETPGATILPFPVPDFPSDAEI